MPEPTAVMLTKQYEALKLARINFESQWQQVADYGLGRRDFITESVQGRPRQTHIYDATFQHSADSLAAAIQALLVNQAAQWMWLAPEDPTIQEVDEVVEYHREKTDITFKIFNHPEANFAPQMHEHLIDVVAFGSSPMYVDKDDTGIYFSSRPLMECFVDVNQRGVVDTVFRKFSLTSRNAIEQWGEEAGAAVKKAYDEHKFDQKFEFLHAVMPRKDASDFIFSKRRLPIASFYVNLQEKRVVSESGYHEMPYMFSRWSTDPDEYYGRGPGINALPDAKMLNRMAKTMLAAAEKATDPPLLVSDDGVISPPRTHPGAINMVRSGTSRTDPLSYLESRARPDITQERYNAVREQVRGHFYHELLQTFEDPRMTATQVLELSSRTAQRIGPMIFRLQSHLLEPMVTRVHGLAERAGLYPPAPPGYEDMRFKVDYVSPAARAQLNADVQSVIAMTNTHMQWAQVNPDAMDNIDLDKASAILGKALGEANKIRRSRKEVRAIRDAKAEAAEERAGMEQMGQMADAANKAAPMLQMLEGDAA